MGWQNLYADEESGADTFQITNFSFVGFDVHGLIAQNFGPILNAVMATGTLNTNCDYGTTGAYLGDTFFHGFDSWTIGSPSQAPNPGSPKCGDTPIAAVLHDAPGTLVSNGHCELFSNCVLIGANNTPTSSSSGERVRGIVGSPSTKAGINVVQISGNYPSNTSVSVENILRQPMTTNTILDGIKNITITDPIVGSYAWDTNSTTLNTSIVTTSASIPNRLDGGITAAFTSVLIPNSSTAPVVNELVKLTGSPIATATLERFSAFVYRTAQRPGVRQLSLQVRLSVV